MYYIIDDTEVIGQGRMARLFSFVPRTNFAWGAKPFETLSSASIILSSTNRSHTNKGIKTNSQSNQYYGWTLPMSVPASTWESGVADIEERGAGEGTAGVVDTRSMSTSTSPPWPAAELFPFPLVITGSNWMPPLLGDLTLGSVVTRLSTYAALVSVFLSGERLVST